MKHFGHGDDAGPSFVAFPDHASLAALRAWYEGISARAAVSRYLPHARVQTQSSRGVIGRIKRRLVRIAQVYGRYDIASVFADHGTYRSAHVIDVRRAIEELRLLAGREPQINDDITLWLPTRAIGALNAQGITTLAELTLRVPRCRMWWCNIAGIGPASARDVEAFFSHHPLLTNAARQLVERFAPREHISWRQFESVRSRNGSQGKYRAPKLRCLLDATTDKQAIEAWLALHETDATSRAYRKEAERLLLWANVERKRALSSLSTNDAIAYRAFLRFPEPRDQWVGPRQVRQSDDWRPFFRRLRPSSVAYALSVLSAMFRWLVEQQYVVANPFAGITAGHTRQIEHVQMRALRDEEWRFARRIANELSTSYGWSVEAAQRLCFILDFELATGLRASELIHARLGDLYFGDADDVWLRLIGKGRRAARVAMPPLAMRALQTYLQQRSLPADPRRCNRDILLVAALSGDQTVSISGTRLRAVLKRFFRLVGQQIEATDSSAAQRLEQASPHWLRHYIPFRIMSCNRVMGRF
ncbi:phage integrase family protein [Caballeronia sordidicola]|uniref:Mobile element protein n=1 Tax=Caballeronia sordidicola TaxID=196367 RepID=A0A226WYH2_CABSO|nr:phage integrase family protein [Caballeronia sordidicola]OXC76224.1 Mobile element protein [Caballeronia sordidicola]